MPDEQNVPVGRTGQTVPAQVEVRGKTPPGSVPNSGDGHDARSVVKSLSAATESALQPVDANERVRIALHLRKARATAPLNLLPLLTLLLAACGKVAPEAASTPDPDAGSDPETANDAAHEALNDAAVDEKFARQEERFDITLAALEDRLNARITYSQLATIIILTAVMGAFNIWG